MSRVDHWRKSLGEYIRSVKHDPYQHGKQDSWLFACSAAESITGTDHAKKHRGKYKTARGALSIIRRAGAKDLADFTALFFEEYESSAQARIGDIAAIPADGPFGYSLGIVNGETVFVVTADGLGIRHMLEAKRAFRVG